jgi:superoxide dismutase
MTFELNAAMLEIIGQGFTLLDQDKSLAILNNYSHDTDKTYRMGEDPLGWRLHPPDANPFR